MSCLKNKVFKAGLNFQNSYMLRCEHCQIDFSVEKGYGDHFLCRECCEYVKTLIISRGHTKEYQRVTATEEYIKDGPQMN